VHPGRPRRSPSIAHGATAVFVLFFLTGLLQIAWTQSTRENQESTDNGIAYLLSPRFALAVDADESDPASRLVVDAAGMAVQDQVDALFFLTEMDRDIDRLAATAWRSHQAEVLIVLSVEPGDGDARTIRAQFFRVSAYETEPEDLGETSVSIRIDNAGRYQRSSNYEPIVSAVSALLTEARPGRELVIRSNGPFSVDGLPAYVSGTETDTDELTVELRGLTEYTFTVHRVGYRSETRTIYLERRRLVTEVPLKPYPRHSVAPVLRNVSFPGIEYAYYPESTRWMATAGITSFLFGLTPMRQIAHDDSEAQLITSYGLTEIEGGWQFLFRSRDKPHRFGVGPSVTARLVHGNVDFGFDPILPGAVRLVGSWEWELPGRLTLSQRLSSDWFYSFRPEFLMSFPWMRKVGPVYWQLPIYRIGLRVRI
jgi:hypothetical protein